MLISPSTKIYAILGDPISHSMSPVMYNAVFKYYNLDKIFIALRTNKEKLKIAIDMVINFNIGGLSVTMPLKEHILKYLDNLSKDAQIIESVNCVTNNNGFLTGYNTDGKGFISSIGNYFDKINKIFIFGAGGLSKAIIYQLLLYKRFELFVTNRHISRALHLIEKYNNLFIKSKVSVIPWNSHNIHEAICESDLIINATSLGMKNVGDISLLIPWNRIKKEAIIYETVYNPLNTYLIKRAEKGNFKTINGVDLLINQAVLAYEIWVGEKPPIKVIREAIIPFLERLDKIYINNKKYLI